MEPKSRKQSFFKEWLEKLQQESWQLELLISGLALFGVWEAMKLLNRFRQDLSGSTDFAGTLGEFNDLMLDTMQAGLSIVMVNFLIHVSLRALWIGAIGLRYVSGDIDYDALKYSKRFTSYYKRNIGTFDQYIEKLENWCSVIFAYTFLVVGIFTSLALYMMWFVVATELILFDAIRNDAAWPVVIWFMFLIVYFALGLIVFIDFITLGALRKTEDNLISKLYLQIYKFFGYLTLSFVYRPILLNFFDTKFTKRLFFLSIPYALVVMFVMPKLKVQAFSHYPSASYSGIYEIESRYYDDLRQEEFEKTLKNNPVKERIRAFSLDQHVVDKPYAKVFFSMYEEDADYFSLVLGIQGYVKTGLIFGRQTMKDTAATAEADTLRDVARSIRAERRTWRDSEGITDSMAVESAYRDRLDSISNIISSRTNTYNINRSEKITKAFLDLIEISIDSVDYKDSVSCKFFVHPNLGEKGFQCIYPTGALSEGEHTMHITRRTFKKNNFEEMSTIYWSIPFYKYE